MGAGLGEAAAAAAEQSPPMGGLGMERVRPEPAFDPPSVPQMDPWAERYGPGA